MIYKKRKKITTIKNKANNIAAVLQGIAAIFYSTKNNQNQKYFTILNAFLIFKRVFSIFHRGRSPPFHTDFSNKNQYERKAKYVFF